MKRLTAKVTSKGQITIPAEVRERLGVRVGDRVSFEVEDSGIRVERARSVVDETAGAFKKYFSGPPRTVKQIKKAAEDAWTDEATERDARSMRRP